MDLLLGPHCRLIKSVCLASELLKLLQECTNQDGCVHDHDVRRAAVEECVSMIYNSVSNITVDCV